MNGYCTIAGNRTITSNLVNRLTLVVAWDTHNDAVLAVVRHVEGRTVLGLFNFSSARQSAHLDSDGDIALPAEVALEPYQVCVVEK